MSSDCRGSRPNLVYIFADQLRYQSCGYTGDSLARTPNIDRLAAEAVSFTNAVSACPLCGPYRASIFTGKYPSSNGMFFNDLRCPPDPNAIGHVLTRAGYRTAYIGKWHLYGRIEEEQFVPPGPYRMGFDDYWASYCWNHKYLQGFYYENTPERKEMPGYQPDFETDLAIAYLRKARRGQPFALFLSYETPHYAVTNWPESWGECPEEFARLYNGVRFPVPPNYCREPSTLWRAGFTDAWWQRHWDDRRERYMQTYYGMVANLDWNLGRLLSALDELHLKEDTLVVFTSDHGEMFSAHGRDGKIIFFDESVRVPFLMRWPGVIPAGLASDACLNTPDIMPTLLDLLGVPIPEGVEGMSLGQAARGLPGPEPEAAYMQMLAGAPRWGDGEWRALRDKRFTYAVMREGRREFLFDNQADPYQLDNLAGNAEYAAMLNRFRAMLAERMETLGDTFASRSWYYDNWTEDGIVIRTATGNASNAPD